MLRTGKKTGLIARSKQILFFGQVKNGGKQKLKFTGLLGK